MGVSPGHVGWGYQSQRRYLEEADAKQDRFNKQYHSAVVQPQIEKTLAQLNQERVLEQEAKQRMDAAAQYVQQQQLRQRHDFGQDLKRQIDEQDYQKQRHNQDTRLHNESLHGNQMRSQAILDQQERAVKESKVQQYKADLDRQKAQRDQMKAYGNMSAAEKALNKDDLRAFKDYDGTNYSMIPGVQSQNVRNTHRQSPSPTRLAGSMSAQNLPSPKRFKHTAEKVLENQDRLKKFGAVNLSKEVASYEPKAFLGQGNIINGGIANSRLASSPEADKFKRANSLYSGPAGSSLGPGRMLNDGTIDFSAQQLHASPNH